MVLMSCRPYGFFVVLLQLGVRSALSSSRGGQFLMNCGELLDPGNRPNWALGRQNPSYNVFQRFPIVFLWFFICKPGFEICQVAPGLLSDPSQTLPRSLSASSRNPLGSLPPPPHPSQIPRSLPHSSRDVCFGIVLFIVFDNCIV